MLISPFLRGTARRSQRGARGLVFWRTLAYLAVFHFIRPLWRLRNQTFLPLGKTLVVASTALTWWVGIGRGAG